MLNPDTLITHVHVQSSGRFEDVIIHNMYYNATTTVILRRLPRIRASDNKGSDLSNDFGRAFTTIERASLLGVHERAHPAGK